MSGAGLEFSNLWGYRTAVAEWASILAIVISTYAAATIRLVRRDILKRVALPQLLDEITKRASAISGLMRQYQANRNEIGVEMSRCDAHLKVLNTKVSGDVLVTVTELRATIKRYKARPRWFRPRPQNSKQDAWRIYEQMIGLSEELKHFIEDQRIGG